MNYKKAMKLNPCAKCKKAPSAYMFPSGYRQVGCFECDRIFGGNDADIVVKQWETENKP